MSEIFERYTGNPFINASLQTIEVLAGLDAVSDITTDVLLEIYQKYRIWELFKRMKSYSMLFSRNGPLLNDKGFGDKIYKGIIEYILNNFQKEGRYQCEVSGLDFELSFSEIYEKVLHDINYPIGKIKGKDKTINRCWFPLVGALGSDAQALPRAMFDIKIHPICLVVIQFLPFSSLLYKGGILLIDSMDLEFTKDYVSGHVKRVLEEIEITEENKSVENIRNFTGGDYILKAIKIYSEKKNYYESYSDLNLWSFSNSGTGASCTIDRIPNFIFRTLYGFYILAKVKNDLVAILTNSISNSFLECLFEKKDFWGLYPRKAKGKLVNGVGVSFFDAYQKVIGNHKQLEYAKYLAYLIEEDKEKSKANIKLLEKTAAHKEKEYNFLIYAVLFRAVRDGRWTLANHLEILDETDVDLISDWTYGIHKMTHYYYQKKEFLNKCPVANPTNLTPVISTVIHLVKNDMKSKKSIDRLQHSQNYETFNINNILIRNSGKISLGAIIKYFHKDYHLNKRGLNKLLRLYFSEPVDDNIFEDDFYSFFQASLSQSFEVYENFVLDFQRYYLEKYNQDKSKYKKHVLDSFPNKTSHFKMWILSALENMSIYYKGNYSDKGKLEYYEENLFYDPNGAYNLNFSMFAIHFLFNQIFLNK